jgi:hypothetical protein
MQKLQAAYETERPGVDNSESPAPDKDRRDDEVGGHGWKVGRQAALVSAVANPQRWAIHGHEPKGEGQNPHLNVAGQ